MENAAQYEILTLDPNQFYTKLSHKNLGAGFANC
jgi:hypothetical protein